MIASRMGQGHGTDALALRLSHGTRWRQLYATRFHGCLGHGCRLSRTLRVRRKFMRISIAQNNGRTVVRSQIKRSESSETERTWSPLGTAHEIGDVIADKYKIIGVLGSGGVGTTYEAEMEGGFTVALKAMSLRSMKAWKNLELFEREARLLKSLRHPNIPEYVDYFEIDSSTDRVFYLAQKVAQGKSLADLVREGWHFTEEEVVQIALQVLEVLKYLCSLRPPVYHRDIKPENIILDRDTAAVKVVDFGAVQDAASETVLGSTIVGTYGYMAPEQFQNRATPQTDLYALGGTLLFLLSGRPPSSFPQKRLKIDYSSVDSSPRLLAVIDKLMEPAPEDRFQSASEVISSLTTAHEPVMDTQSMISSKGYNAAVGKQGSKVLRRPAGTKVDLRRSPEALEITIPPDGFNSETVGTGSFAVAWNTILAIWTKTALGRGPGLGSIALFSLPFWFVGARLTRMTLSKLTVAVSLKIEERQFSIERRIGNLWTQRVVGDTKDIISAEVYTEESEQSRTKTSTCRIVEGVNVHEFGSGLQPVEKKWIVQELSDFLGRVNDQGR